MTEEERKERIRLGCNHDIASGGFCTLDTDHICLNCGFNFSPQTPPAGYHEIEHDINRAAVENIQSVRGQVQNAGKHKPESILEQSEEEQLLKGARHAIQEVRDLLKAYPDKRFNSKQIHASLGTLAAAQLSLTNAITALGLEQLGKPADRHPMAGNNAHCRLSLYIFLRKNRMDKVEAEHQQREANKGPLNVNRPIE